MITNNIDDLFFSVNDIYSQWDEGQVDYEEASNILRRICQHYINAVEREHDENEL
jgi:hypothetical protein